MSWKLWLDDQLDDPNCPTRHTPKGFQGAKNFGEATELVLRCGVPSFMDLDYDLGSDNDGTTRTVMEFLYWLEELMNGTVDEDESFLPLRPPPSYEIHSENPVGQNNIESFLQAWRKNYGS